MMTAFLAGVDVNLKLLNLMSGEQLKPEFLKINPQHNVPTIDDDGFRLNESRAICTYIISRYGQKVQHLYPEDPQQRATIDQLLNFDASILFPNLRDLYVRKKSHLIDTDMVFMSETFGDSGSGRHGWSQAAESGSFEEIPRRHWFS